MTTMEADMLKTVLLFCLMFVGCGDEEDNPSPPSLPPENVQVFNAVVKPLAAKNCGGSKCHTSGAARDAVIQNAGSFLNGSACDRVKNGSMPVPGSPQAENFPDREKAIILGYCSKYGG